MVAHTSAVVDGKASVELAADMGDVVSARYLEIPIKGPGQANNLVVIDGIAVPDLDTNEKFGLENPVPPVRVNFFIDTNYKLGDDDSLIDHSAYVCLSSINADDSTEFRLALDGTDVKVRTSKVVQLIAFGGVGGDTGLMRIGFQVNLLVRKSRS
jgi:hypothetical protein